MGRLWTELVCELVDWEFEVRIASATRAEGSELSRRCGIVRLGLAGIGGGIGIGIGIGGGLILTRGVG